MIFQLLLYICAMRHISINSLREYWEIHPETQQLPLSEWYLKVSKAEREVSNI